MSNDNQSNQTDKLRKSLIPLIKGAHNRSSSNRHSKIFSLETYLKVVGLLPVPLSNLPAVGYELMEMIKNHFRQEKILNFLDAADSTISKEMDQFIDELESNDREAKELYLSILLLIEEYNQIEKSKILAKLFVAYRKKRIDKQKFDTYSFSLIKINVNNLDALKKFYNNEKDIDQSLLMSFLSEGFLQPSRTLGDSPLMENDFGREFVAILEEDFSSKT